jgi:hypothetical protein
MSILSKTAKGPPEGALPGSVTLVESVCGASVWHFVIQGVAIIINDQHILMFWAPYGH